MRPENAIQTSIASIIRALLTATAISALVAIAFLLLDLSEVAAPFLLATTVGFGLTVISVIWRALTRAHQSST